MQMKKVKKGDTIAITVGSRQIANLPLIVKTLAEELKKIGACPFVVPAMGSHGGATAEGQKAIVESYGMSESYTGIPIKSTMETTNIGLTEDGRPTFIDAYAAKANYIIALNRIKPHTSFRGKYESGLMKILVIGLGKQRGAEICHNEGFGRMAYNIEMFGKSIITHAPILLGIGIVENAFDKTFKIEALTPQQIISEEPKLLSLAKEKMGKILFSSCDVLIVDQIGKNISGGGMDPNITGRFSTSYATGGIKAQTVTVLDMTKESHGSALGIGVAETTTQKLWIKLAFLMDILTVLLHLSFPIVVYQLFFLMTRRLSGDVSDYVLALTVTMPKSSELKILSIWIKSKSLLPCWMKQKKIQIFGF